MKHLRIKTFILITVLILVALSLSVLTFLLMSFYGYSIYDALRDSITEHTEGIITSLESEGVDACVTNERLSYKLADYAEEDDGRILVVDRDYKVLQDTDKSIQDSYIVNEKLMSIMKGEKKYDRYDTEDELVIISPVVLDGSVTGAVIYRASIAEIKKMSSRLMTISILVSLIIFAIDLILVILISRRSVKDINDINEKIMHTALGNFQERLPEDTGFIEAQVLAENFNDVLEKLASIDQTRSEFVSNVSHELKTPITSMKVLAESITENEGASVEDYREFMTDIVDEIDRETKIINDLLTLVRTDSKKDEMNFEEADINEMMETIIKTVTPLAKQRGISLSYDSFREVKARVDAVKLSLAISNLIENAVKYNIDNGWINCSLNADNKFFYIKVADSGVGIPEDAKDKVFERFYRVDKARSRDTGGTGLGLSITRSIVSAHKGTIKLYSESGKGTTFTVKIPIDNR